MEDSFDPDLTYECLIHDLNNVFETITEAAELLSSDRQWRSLAATLRRSVERGKRLVGAIPDHTPDLAAVIEDAIQSAQDFCVTTRKPRIEFTANLSVGIPLPGSAKEWERVFVNLFLNAAQAFRRPGLIEIAAEREDDSLKIIVASIVKRYGGKVTAGNREKSSGAVFTISLPFATTRAQAAEQ